MVAVAGQTSHDYPTVYIRAWLKAPLLGGVSEGRGGLQKNCKSPLRLCETPPLGRGGASDVAQLKSITIAAQPGHCLPAPFTTYKGVRKVSNNGL